MEGGSPMVVYVVIREDQNEHGFVDTSIDGLFRTQQEADAFVDECTGEARAEGLRLEDDYPGDWDVYWKVEQHTVD
ncbi:MAG: hypothetical protein DMF87_11860 [Acidobacteria bacterium]|nr:MAG: hypothetical protein DMF87_11860 [Acidobacteriota bacterium]